MDNKIVKHETPISYLKQVVDEVSTSDLVKSFRLVDKDGNYILDEDKKPTIDKGAVLTNLMMGQELGLKPMSSLMLGKTLNAKSFFSVLKGRSLGLDPITSISKIYNISTRNGDVLALAVDIISMAISRSGTTMDYIRDAELVPTYKTMTGAYAGHKYQVCDADGATKDSYYISDLSPKEIAKSPDDLARAQAAKKEGKVILYQSGTTKVTSLRLVRELSNDKVTDITFHYSIQEAIDAGLVSGTHSSHIDPTTGQLEVITTTSAWTFHENTMLRNRVTSISGRIVVADLLAGTYSHDEAVEIVNLEENTDYQDITEVKNKQ